MPNIIHCTHTAIMEHVALHGDYPGVMLLSEDYYLELWHMCYQEYRSLTHDIHNPKTYKLDVYLTVPIMVSKQLQGPNSIAFGYKP